MVDGQTHWGCSEGSCLLHLDPGPGCAAWGGCLAWELGGPRHARRERNRSPRQRADRRAGQGLEERGAWSAAQQGATRRIQEDIHGQKPSTLPTRWKRSKRKQALTKRFCPSSDHPRNGGEEEAKVDALSSASVPACQPACLPACLHLCVRARARACACVGLCVYKSA